MAVDAGAVGVVPVKRAVAARGAGAEKGAGMMPEKLYRQLTVGKLREWLADPTLGNEVEVAIRTPRGRQFSAWAVAVQDWEVCSIEVGVIRFKLLVISPQERSR